MDFCKELTTIIQAVIGKMDVGFWKDISEITQSVLTSLGILIGGIWTYLLFVRQRLHFPKINIGLSINAVLLPDGNRLIHAEVKIDNVGSVIFCSNYAELRIRQVVPVPDEIDTLIEADEDPVKEGTEVVWPMLFNREWKWGDKCFEIEPGESDSLHADYIIPGHIEVVEFYSFISNAKKQRHGLGWTLTQLNEFHLNEVEMAAKKTQNQGSKNIQKVNEQQRQQKQQKQQQQQQQQQQEEPKKKK